MDDVEFAWACGLFEGEGSITYNVYPTKTQRRLTLGTTDLDVLERFKEAVGCGRIVGPYAGTNKPMYHWVEGKWADIAALLERMRPYLGTRRQEQADRLLADPPTTVTHCRNGHPRAHSSMVGGQLRCALCDQARVARRREHRRAAQTG